MAKTNFKVFNEANTPERTYNDSEYAEATQRLNGVIPGMALSRMHNKMYYQWSAMCKAIADFIVSHGDDCMDNDVAGISAAIGRAIAGSVGNAIATHNSAPAAHENRFAEVANNLEDHKCDSVAHIELFDQVYSEITSHNNSPNAHLALFAQIRQSLTAHNAAADAHADIRQLCENAGINFLRRNHAYAVGDIAYSKNLPSWARLECVQAGTTAASEPGGLAAAAAGTLVTDGGVRWIVDDVRDGTTVGTVRGSLYLPPGYIKANGATVQRADYPRLVTLANRYNLWTNNPWGYPGLFGRGDGAATMVLPNWIDRMAQFAANSAGAVLAAGLPNITGVLGWWSNQIEKITQKTGAFLGTHSIPGASWTGQTAVNATVIDFNANKSNAIYGASNTVQPPAIKVMPIIRY